MDVHILYCTCILSFGYVFSFLFLVILLELKLFFLITQLNDLYAGDIYFEQIKDITVTDR